MLNQLIQRKQRSVAISSAGQFRHHRAGALVVEMVVCTILLGVVSLALVPAIHAVNQQRQAIRFQAFARIELNNLHQSMLHDTTGAAAAESAQNATVLLSTGFQSRYPLARLAVTEMELAAADHVKGLRARRLSIEQPAGSHKPAQKCTVVVWLPKTDDQARSEIPEGGDKPEGL